MISQQIENHLALRQYDEARQLINQIMDIAPRAYITSLDDTLLLIDTGTIICDTNTANNLLLTQPENTDTDEPPTSDIIEIKPINYREKPQLTFYADPLFPSKQAIYIDHQDKPIRLKIQQERKS